MKTTTKNFLWLTLFSIAMGYMETAVVVYLREIYYPEGFKFPLAPIDPSIAVTEFFREIATIIMLAGIGILTGKTKLQRFAYFIYCFAIWDIFYYIFLKLLLGWPISLFTWDILFLIPVPWVGPVIAPCIVSLTMILLSFLIVRLQEKGLVVKFLKTAKLIAILGCLVIIYSFIRDYINYATNSNYTLWTLFSKENMFTEIATYMPVEFSWTIFIIGECLLLIAILMFYRNNKICNVNRRKINSF